MRLLLLSLLLASPAWASEVPVYQKVARRALGGDFGELEWWQRKGYQRIADGAKVKQYTAWVTNYWPGEPGVNRTTASGMPVSSRVAAMIDRAWGTYVLISLPAGYELRQVFDTGSRKNIDRARHPKKYGSNRRPAQTWVDRCYPRRPATRAERGLSAVRSVYVF